MWRPQIVTHLACFPVPSRCALTDGSLGTKLGQRAAHVVLLPLRALRWFFPLWDFWRANGKDGRHPVMLWGQDFLGL